MKPKVGDLVLRSLEQTNAHGLARLASEKRLYIRALWLLAWLVCFGLFVSQMIGFIKRLQSNDVTTNFRADEVPFEYPDLYFCFNNPMSGSRHLEVSPEFAALVNKTLADADAAIKSWCSQMPAKLCDQISRDSAELILNSLPFKRLVDEMGHTQEQSIMLATLARTNGLDYYLMQLEAKPFYHPKHLRCFKMSLSDTQREIMRITGPDDVLFVMVMMDAPDKRMGLPKLPVIRGEFYNISAPYWALDRIGLASRVRSSTLRIYVTSPGHYPSDFNEKIVLESGRTYNIQLEMKEQVYKNDPTRCTDSHPNVQIVNPYDNSAYSVAYDYGYCYMSAMQTQFRRVLNASLGYLPQPWPPADRLLFNLSSSWGSLQDVTNFLENVADLSIQYPLDCCVDLHPCTERIYSSNIRGTVWPVENIFTELVDYSFSYSQDQTSSTKTALEYLNRISASKNYSNELHEYLQANMLQMQITAKKSMSDRIIITRAYSFESFIADLGGILGIYLGMSVLTACEVIQFLYDLALICLAKTKIADKKAPVEMPEKKTSKNQKALVI